jgi:hypothetical protein
MKVMSYYLTVDYEDFKPKTYNGLSIYKSNYNSKSEKIVSVNTGILEDDEDIALDKLYDLVGEVQVQYLSSYDNYLDDLYPCKISQKIRNKLVFTIIKIKNVFKRKVV